ncbi:Aryl-alcohol oxidase-like protein [Mycena sanguinolenta]|uniref:Aryl-alcohol oxidase-like protein n=1 Tax=Mycena sanguinolenta TaxID=230812 RepID=A0A8H6YZ68_9AGAR|nr:Aryl-alcohol oxidase-like protein [Mycena sanguinolenta]
MGKVHGSLARAGKVKGQTPKVEPQEKKKTPKGRAKKRILYNRRFVNVTTLPGGKRRMNPNPEKALGMGGCGLAEVGPDVGCAGCAVAGNTKLLVARTHPLLGAFLTAPNSTVRGSVTCLCINLPPQMWRF